MNEPEDVIAEMQAGPPEVWIDQEDRLDEQEDKDVWGAAYRAVDAHPDDADCYVTVYIDKREKVEDFLATRPGGILISCVQTTHVYRSKWRPA